MTISRLIGIVVTAGASLVGAVAFINSGASPVQQTAPTADDVNTTTVELMDIEVEIEADGNIAADKRVPLTFGNTYVVREVFVEEGDSVQAGDVIATLDMADYNLALAGAENELARRENSFNGVVAVPRDVDLRAAQAGVDAAQAEYYAAGQTAPTEEEIEIARIGIEQAKNELWQGQLNRDIQEEIPAVFRTSPGSNPFAEEVKTNDRVSQLETGVDIAAMEFEEIQELGPDGNVFGASQQAIADAEINFDNLINPDAFDVEMAALNIHQAALNVERIGVQIVDMQLVAPFDGVIVENNLEVGELPPQGAAVVLADTTTLTVDLEVDETDVVNVTEGQAVNITVDALPEAQFGGSITEIDLLPLPEKVVPTYRVEVQLAPSGEPLQPGMSARGTIVVDAITDAVVVPSRAVQTDADGTFVTIIEEGEQRRVLITTGRSSDGFTQVTSGLTPGQRVVLPE
jgi:HlyD family secretion protein